MQGTRLAARRVANDIGRRVVADVVAENTVSAAVDCNAPVSTIELSATNQLVKKEMPCLDTLSKAGKVMDHGGLTKAGRALDKHGNRPGSTFPKATGNPVRKNIQGQYQLDDIITEPNSLFIKDFKKGDFKIYSQDGRGAYFRSDGSFRGFIEKKYE